jgi:LETM1 and EF-hand domain-containing protein 1
MVDKEGTEGEEEAKKAYRAAREESDHAAETAISDKISSALINRVSYLESSVLLASFSFFIYI